MSETPFEAVGERLLTFEVAEVVYALPIAEVLEVAEPTRLTCIPTLPTWIAGVMNWHGEAIPVIASDLLLCPDGVASERALTEPPAAGRALRIERDEEDTDAHVLIVSDRPEESARMGIQVDRIHGLVNGPTRRAVSGAVVSERRPLDGRVVSVIDPRRLVGRAEDVIRRAAE